MSIGQSFVRTTMVAPAALALVLSSCGSSGNESTPAPTESPSAVVSPSASLSPEPTTPVPTASPDGSGGGGEVPTTPLANPPPLPSPQPIPNDWVTFSQAATNATAEFSLRLPPDWTLPPAPPTDLQHLDNWAWVFTSWDPAIVKSTEPPKDAIAIDFGSWKSGAGYRCEIFTNTTSTLAGIDVMYGVVVPDPASPINIQRGYSFVFTYGSFQYCVSAIVTKQSNVYASDPEQTLSQILNSLRFAD